MKAKQLVYLSGGFHSGWMEKMDQLVECVDFISPSLKEKNHEMTLEEYGTWDLHYIKECNIFFAYMERTNPSGWGLAVEIGYAKGIGKTVILVIEDNNEYHKDRYLQFLKKAADVVYTELEDGIKYLKSFK